MSKPKRTGVPPLKVLESQFYTVLRELESYVNQPLDQLPTENFQLKRLSDKTKELNSNFTSLYSSYFHSLDKAGAYSQLTQLRGLRKNLKIEYDEFKRVLDSRLVTVNLPVLPDLDTSFHSPKSPELELENSVYLEVQSTPSEHSGQDLDEYRRVDVSSQLMEISQNLGRLNLGTTMSRSTHSVLSQPAEHIMNMSESLCRSRASLDTPAGPSLFTTAQPQGTDPFLAPSNNPLDGFDDTYSQSSIPTPRNNKNPFIISGSTGLITSTKSDSLTDSYTGSVATSLPPGSVGVSSNLPPSAPGATCLDFSTQPGIFTDSYSESAATSLPPGSFGVSNTLSQSAPGATCLDFPTQPGILTDSYSGSVATSLLPSNSGVSSPGRHPTHVDNSSINAPRATCLDFTTQTGITADSYSGSAATKLFSSSIGVSNSSRNYPPLPPRRGEYKESASNEPIHHSPSGLNHPSSPFMDSPNHPRVSEQPINLTKIQPSTRRKVYFTTSSSSQPPSGAVELSYESSTQPIINFPVRPASLPPSYDLGSRENVMSHDMTLRDYPRDYNPQFEPQGSTIPYLLPPSVGFSSDETPAVNNVLSSPVVRRNIQINPTFPPVNPHQQTGFGLGYHGLPESNLATPGNSGYSVPNTRLLIPSPAHSGPVVSEEYSVPHADHVVPPPEPRYPQRGPTVSSHSTSGLFVPRPPTCSPNNVDSNQKFFESFLNQSASSRNDPRPPVTDSFPHQSQFNHQNPPHNSYPNPYYPYPPMLPGSYPHPYYFPPYGAFQQYAHPPAPQADNSQFQALSNHILQMELVKTGMEKFDGKAHKFHSWYAKLSDYIAKLQMPPADIMRALQSQVSGEPKVFIDSKISSVGHHPSHDDVDRVIKEMAQRFGSSTRISKELNDLIEKFPSISGKNQNQQLYHLVDLCTIILHNQPKCSELIYLDCAQGLRPIRAKLPEYIQRAWAKEGYTYGVHHEEKHPPFSYFTEFLKKQAEMYNDESFHIIPQNPVSSSSKRQVKVLATQIESPSDSKSQISNPKKKAYCLHHRIEGHTVHQCKDLNKMGQNNVERRNKRLNELGLCSRCLYKHSVENCKVKVVCDICRHPHATILHIYRRDPRKPSNRPRVQSIDTQTNTDDPGSTIEPTPIPQIPPPRILCTKVPQPQGLSCSKTLLVEITMSQKPEMSMMAYAIVDEQCNSTLVDTRVLEFFDLDFPSADYSIKFATQDCEERTFGKYVTGLRVKGMLMDEIIPIPEALSCSNLADTTQEVASPELVRSQRLISQFADYFPEFQPNTPVLLIIGRNCGRAMATQCLTTVEPYVHKTPLGYSLVGNVGGVKPSNDEVRVYHTNLERDHPVEVKYNFTKKPTETFDTYATYPDDEHPGSSHEDKQFMSEVVPKININSNNNIELPLPLRTTELPQNKVQVFHRTKKTLQNLQKNPEKLQHCLNSVEKNIQKGYVEPVPSDEIDNPIHQTWYLPIFPVENKNKAPRLVYDASAKYHGISLNDVLLQGPDLNNQLRSVLLRFREKPIAFAADIEAMFNNFAVPLEQKDLLRFFWFKDNDPNQDLVPYRSTSHIFGCVSSPAVSNCGLKYCAEQLPTGDEAKDYLDRNFYVDDGLHSTDSSDSATGVLTKTMSLLKTYNMKLHKIVSNSPEVLEAFPDAVKTASITTLPSEGENTAALGVQWNTESDNFLLIPNLPSRPFTKRGILSTINSLFDPIGIASPVILFGRIMQRQILLNNPQLEKYGWDDLLPSQYFNSWSNWLESLDQLSSFQIPRSFYPEGFKPIRQELHVFCDASEHAIGHVNYLRSIDHAGTCHVSFVSASSKLAPKAATSIPRLELNAAVEACKNANKIMADLKHKPNAVYFHSDSQIVLGYLKNQKRRFSKYVERRITVIHNLFPDAHWFYIGSKENPADHASRPSTPQEILSSNWLRGPTLLWESSYDPESQPDPAPLPTILPEEDLEVSVLSTKVITPSPFSDLFSKINSFPKLVNIFSHILKFARILHRIRQRNGCLENPRSMEVSHHEAKTTLLKVVQAECFSEEIRKIKSGTALSDNHKLSNLAPSVDKSGLLRVGGRLKHSDVDFSVKHPILIPQDHPLSSTIIQYFHGLNKHQGSLITHNSIIQHGYHIQNGRTLIRNFLKSCVTCRKLRGKPSEQIMADLPPDRLVENVPPFTHVGIDVFGPFYIHDGKRTRANTGTKKIWALIIVCLPSRAIHLEYLSGMDTSSFRNAFNRFRAIRGPCQTIRSDRGTNFVLARKQMEAVDISSFSKELQAEGIQWTFNSPYASHQGGCWERKIGSVRRVLEATFNLISQRGISRDEFITFLAEAASIVNNTPLWTPSNDPNDPSPLTPQMLLTLRRADEFHTLDDYTPEDILSYGPKRYRRCQYLASQFWHRWRSEYLHTLTSRQKWRKPSPCIQEGDLVLIKDKNLARNQWPMARVRLTKPSSDGLIRKVTLTLPPLPGRSSMRSLDRAIQDLVLLIPSDSTQKVTSAS